MCAQIWHAQKMIYKGEAGEPAFAVVEAVNLLYFKRARFKLKIIKILLIFL